MVVLKRQGSLPMRIKNRNLAKIYNMVSNNPKENFTDFIGVTSEGERQLAAFTKTVEANKTSIQGQIDVLNAQGNQEEKIFDLREQLIDQDIALIDKRRSLGVKLTEEQLNFIYSCLLIISFIWSTEIFMSFIIKNNSAIS